MYKELFNSISFGEMQSYMSVNAFPLISPVSPAPLHYLTLVEAIEQMLLKIEEVSEGGSVPELRVVSKAKVPVLLVSGEEVKGAKQNLQSITWRALTRGETFSNDLGFAVYDQRSYIEKCKVYIINPGCLHIALVFLSACLQSSPSAMMAAAPLHQLPSRGSWK